MRTPAPWQLSLLVSSIAVLAGGCDRPAPVAPTDIGAAAVAAPLASAQSGEDLPFHLSGEARLVGQDFAPDFGPPTFGKSTFGGRCSVPSDFVVRFSIAGQATHMGDVTASEEHCSLADFQAGRTLSDSDGEMIITAANGDQLWVRHHRSPGEQDHGRFAGGTGRFTDASGDAVLQTKCDRAAGTCVLEIEGVLSYDAAIISGQ